jgi:nucleoside-diphosphate-sugar epimerase
MVEIDEVEGDMTDNFLMENIMIGVETVYHVGGLVGPYFEKSLYYKVNVEGTRCVIEGCKK